MKMRLGHLAMLMSLNVLSFDRKGLFQYSSSRILRFFLKLGDRVLRNWPHDNKSCLIK